MAYNVNINIPSKCSYQLAPETDVTMRQIYIFMRVKNLSKTALIHDVIKKKFFSLDVIFNDKKDVNTLNENLSEQIHHK